MQKNYTTIQRSQLSRLSTEARATPRLRKNLNIHELDDAIQRFFNALEPNTYVQPHRHLNPPKVETFVIIEGSFLVVIFDDIGTIVDVQRFSKNSHDNVVMDINPGIWHSIICEEPNTVFFEVKSGPYESLSDKDFASWAPPESSPEAKPYRAALYDSALTFLKIMQQ